MSEQYELTIVIPCYNEAENIDRVFPRLVAHCEQRRYQLIVVNDGSKDNSRELLSRYASECVKVISHKLNRGYGAALKTGLQAAVTPWAITIDADGQHRLEDVDLLFARAKESNADLVVGARDITSSGLYRSLGKRVIRGFSRMLMELPVSDLNSGMKLYLLEEARPYFLLCPDTMAFSDIILLLMVNDRRLVIEEKIQVEPRVAGTSTIGIGTAVDTMNEILNIAMLLCPQKLFSFCAAVLFLCGLGWGGYTYWKSSQITTASTMLLLVAGMSFSLGLLGEQLARIRRQSNRVK